MVIIWSKPARNDLHLIHQYIAHDSTRYAKRVVQDITDKVKTLIEVPRLGRVVPEIGEEAVREISLYSWRIMYEIFDDALIIHGVIHKRRHFKPDDLQRESGS